eukprot:scaffold6710_cov267-Chaetoceros_neogracile.AAC.3
MISSSLALQDITASTRRFTHQRGFVVKNCVVLQHQLHSSDNAPSAITQPIVKISLSRVWKQCRQNVAPTRSIDY